jgi:hypothetical protein
MGKLDNNYEALLGRAATEEEKLELYRVKNALGLDDTDSFWLVLMTWGHYETRYKELLKQLHGATEPLKELRNAATIVQALKDAEEATKTAKGVWTKLTACGLEWGLVLGVSLGMIGGTMVGYTAPSYVQQTYAEWNLNNEAEEFAEELEIIKQQRAEIGSMYELLKKWQARGLKVWGNAITIKSERASTGKSDEEGVGIWYK